jgi:hypothetical protein
MSFFRCVLPAFSEMHVCVHSIASCNGFCHPKKSWSCTKQLLCNQKRFDSSKRAFSTHEIIHQLPSSFFSCEWFFVCFVQLPSTAPSTREKNAIGTSRDDNMIPIHCYQGIFHAPAPPESRSLHQRYTSVTQERASCSVGFLTIFAWIPMANMCRSRTCRPNP